MDVYKSKPSDPSLLLRTADVNVHIIVHSCDTQDSIEQFCLIFRQSSQLRYCLLEGMVYTAMFASITGILVLLMV